MEKTKATTVALTDEQRRKVDVMSKKFTGRKGLTAYVCYVIERDWNELIVETDVSSNGA